MDKNPKVLQLSSECKELVRQASIRPGFARLMTGICAYLIEAIADQPLAEQKLNTIKNSLQTFARYKANRGIHRGA